ncbi:MAG TPA: S9 family peptidase [Blastocatellia bacterium]|nr:S9 family peptidase [Blastocatellia bacterium]
MKRIGLTGLLTLTVVLCAIPASGETPTIDQSLNLNNVSGPRFSPDGRYLAYTIQETNWDENAFETEIWIAVIATGERYQLTNARKSSSLPRWSPDSKRLAFVSDREGKRQLYLIAPAGGEAIQLTSLETGVNAFDWSHDGRRIAFTAAEPESKLRKERKEKYGEFEVVKRDYTYAHLWLIDIPSDLRETRAEPVRLTEGSGFSVGGFAWSPDSSRIALSAAADPDISSSGTADIYLLSVSDKKAKRIVATQGPDSNPVWSPDGREIAYQTSNAREFFYYTNSHIAVVNAEGGSPRTLTESFDEQPGLLAWSPAGIYFNGLQRTSSHLFRLNPATKAIERVSEPSGLSASQFSFTAEFNQVAFVGAGANEYPDIHVSSLRPFAPRRITSLSEQLKKYRLATREVISWKSTDGETIEGILIKPAGFDPARKYPLLVVIHGGPTGIDTPVVRGDRTYPLEMFAAKGALILRPNYRGSAGYGEKFRSLNVRNLGVGDYWDVISGVDHLIAQGIVDRDRVGAMGWSQGGYISAFITCMSDRFKAVSVGAGISNWMTYYVNTDIQPFTRQYLQATPWDDPEIYKKTSPISYVKSARTPTLIQHGELDRRVPIPNAYELRQALEDRGVPVKMIVYKGFGHGIDKPKQQRAVMEQNYEWFSEWIWGEKPAAEGK